MQNMGPARLITLCKPIVSVDRLNTEIVHGYKRVGQRRDFPLFFLVYAKYYNDKLMLFNGESCFVRSEGVNPWPVCDRLGIA